MGKMTRVGADLPKPVIQVATHLQVDTQANAAMVGRSVAAA